MRKGLSADLIARVLGAAPKYTLAELEEKFPPRNLPDGAYVTRFGWCVCNALFAQSHGIYAYWWFVHVFDRL